MPAYKPNLKKIEQKIDKNDDLMVDGRKVYVKPKIKLSINSRLK